MQSPTDNTKYKDAFERAQKRLAGIKPELKLETVIKEGRKLENHSASSLGMQLFDEKKATEIYDFLYEVTGRKPGEM